jgi:CubicO group peptidase (beta-lactamase class C family)
MHDDALFRLASLTKPVVSLAALMQVEQGRLALDAPVGDYLPALRACLLGGLSRSRPPTLRDLLRHTSGFAYETEFREAALREIALKDDFGARMPYVDADDFIARPRGRPLAAEPGRAFRYGFSTDVLGLIVAAADGASWARSCAGASLRTAGHDTDRLRGARAEQGRLATAFAADSAWHARVPGYGLRREGRPWMECGGAGLVSTLDDFARFARLIANGPPWRHAADCSESLFLEMTRNQLPEDVDGPLGFTGAGFGFGLGFAVRLDYGAAAMPCAPGELTWSGISGTALFVHPGEQWFALCFSSNMASRMMARMEFRRAVAESL